MDNLLTLKKEALLAIEKAKDKPSLEQVKVAYLGKKGLVTELLKQLADLPIEEKREFGQAVNQAKNEIQSLIEEQLKKIQSALLKEKLQAEQIDVTLPGRGQMLGSLHPVTLVKQEIASIFNRLGFSVSDGPEIEEDYYNFTALNIADNHPARAMHDTFYFQNGTLLRTHMSPVQIRAMKKTPPPLRMIAMGRVYRCDFDVTHTPMFHQLEGLVIDKDISFAKLKGTIIHFLQEFFERPIPVRFRPSFFPFTEPSAEADMQCTHCEGKGCRICKQTGWLEVLGCGMVHPNVLKHGDIDSELFSGFAFGIGIDRLAMLKYKINDLRTLFENDIRFLTQF